jgi:hypothetical protein
MFHKDGQEFPPGVQASTAIANPFRDTLVQVTDSTLRCLAQDLVRPSALDEHPAHDRVTDSSRTSGSSYPFSGIAFRQLRNVTSAVLWRAMLQSHLKNGLLHIWYTIGSCRGVELSWNWNHEHFCSNVIDSRQRIYRSGR